MRSKYLRAKTLKQSPALVLLSLLSTQVLAESYYGEGDFYLGGKFGGALLDLRPLDSQESGQDKQNPVNATTGITFGYHLNNYLAIEADMSYLGRYRSEGANSSEEVNHSEELFSIATYLSTQYRLSDDAALYFKLGPAWVNELVSLSSGLGLKYRMSPRWELDTGYRWIQDTPDSGDDLYEFTIGVTYKFGLKHQSKIAVEINPVAKAEPIQPPLASQVNIDTSELFSFDSNRLINIKSLVNFVDTLAIKICDLEHIASIDITAHTDSVGDKSYNLKLSKRRAEAVKAALITLGLPAKMLHTSWSGEALPVATNSTPEGRAQNRRVEISLKLAE
ncbi:OmpA family protein [Shewanella psychrophila]|nr:outer membrane beta-barrel protein [Shewanella psychrophila]